MINPKKTLTAIALSLVAIQLQAASDTSSQKNNSGTNLKQNQKANKSNATVINPPARPILNDALDFFVDGELLWWKARETGLDFATKTSFPTSAQTNLTNGQFVNNFNGSVKSPHFRWNFGFRVGVGFNMPFDGWDIYLNWARLHTSPSKGTTTADTNLSKNIIPEFQPVGLPDQNIAYSYASPSWRVNYDNIDLELGREFFVSKRLTLRPFVGLRAVWINQKYNLATTATGDTFFITTLAGTPTLDPVSYTLNNKVRMKNNFHGLGPRLGLDTDWYLGAGFSFFGDMAMSILLGQFEVEYNAKADALYSATIEGASEQIGVTTLTNNFHDSRAALDLALGLRWAHRFCDNRYRVRLEIAWEAHEYFSQNQFISFENEVLPPDEVSSGATAIVPTVSSLNANTSKRGDFSMQGLTGAVRFDF